MDQNNNNDKGAVETIKQTAKNEVNKQKNRILGKIFIKIAPYLALFLLCLLAIGLIMATVSTILDFFKGLLGIEAQAAASTLDESQKMISITSNGYKLNDDYADEIIKKLQEQKIETDEVGFSTDGLADMLDKYIKAEVKTMYPSIGGNGDVDGLVKIKRMSAETGESKLLTYVAYDTFKTMVAEGNTDALNRFSLNPENFKLCIAVSKTKTYYDYDKGNKKQKSKDTTLECLEIEYQTSLQRYATPLNYFISMHMVCADKQFMKEFLEMVDEKTDIQLTFLESTYKHITKVDYEGEIITTEYITQNVRELKPEYKDLTTEELAQLKTKIYNEAIEAGKRDVEANKLVTDTLYIMRIQTTETRGETVSVNTGNINHYSDLMEQKQYIIEDSTTQGMLCVTKANTWRLESNLNVQVNGMQKAMIQENQVTNEKTIDESNTMIKSQPASGSYRTGWLKEITNEWTESYSISANETAEGYNLTEFIELIEKYPNVKDNLESAPSLLFYLLENNENTQELASVMKFVIYKLSGIDYGVTEEDLAALLRGATNMVGGDYIVHTEKGQEILKITEIETLKKAFSGYKGSEKLIEHAQDFLDMQETYKVNAIFAAAVSITETSAGRAGNATNGLNNWYNIRGTTSEWKSYSSAEESIQDFGDLIANGSNYFTKGRYTISDIGYKYCPNLPPEYPTQGDEWIESVRGFMTDMYRAAGIDVSSLFNNYSSAVGKIADLINWAESYVGHSQYLHWGGGYKASNGTCAAFVKSAYYYNGFGQVNGSCGIEMEPIGEKGNMVRKADGTFDWSQIPVGAFLVIPPGADGSDGTYGHTALYVGNGYVIEAGASAVQKNKINVDAFSDGGYSYWAIPKEMKEYMNSAEYKALISAQVTSTKGKGYTSQVTVNGKVYNEYKQGSPDYYGITYWDGAFKDYACGPTSLGIIASGYGINQDPVSIAEYMNNRWGYTTPANVRTTLKEKLGLNCTYYEGTNGGTSISEMTNIIKNKLNQGKPLIIDATAGYYTDSGHYMTLLAINDKNEVYLSNPGSSTKNGWIDIQTLLNRNGCGRCVISIDS